MNYKKFLITTLGLTGFWVFLIGGINFIVDPFQFYRRAFYKPLFSNELAYQVAGLARTYDYDTVIIGTSTAQNILPSYVSKKLGVKAMKLALNGATAEEQFLILNLAIKTGKVKKAIWGLDYYSLSGDYDRLKKTNQGRLPYFLYDENPFNDVNLLVNFRTTIDTTKNILRIGKNDNLELLGNEFSSRYEKQPVLDDWNQTISNIRSVSAEEARYSMDKLKANVDENVAKIVKNENVQFYIFFPPYSILNHKAYYKRSKVLFENEQKLKQYIFEKIGAYPNVKIYDFQSDRDITFNLDNYKDIVHYSPKVSEYIIDSIATGKNLVTKNNLNSFLEKLRHQVENEKVEEVGS